MRAARRNQDAEERGLVQELQSLGFTESEARALIALLGSSPATAYEVGRVAGLPRPNAYDALDGLTKKMAIQPISENPARYVPVEPEIMLSRIAQNTSARCRAVARQLSQIKKPHELDYVWSLSGDANIHAKIADMLASSRYHIWIKSDLPLIEPHLEGLRSAAERGVKVVIILFGDAERLGLSELGDQVKVYPHEGSGVAVALSDRLFTLTTDFEEALTASIGEVGFGVYTESRPVVTLVESLIRHEIYVAEIFACFGPEIEQQFGPAMITLRRKYLQPGHVEKLEQRLGLAAADPPAKPRKRAKRPAKPRTTSRGAAPPADDQS